MPERNLQRKLKVLEKYKKELCDKVKFSDVSHHLIVSGVFSKEDCFDICILPGDQQMHRWYEKIIRSLETEKDEKDTWTILLRALNSQHSGFSCKLDGELQKSAKREKPRRLTRDDIGTPLNFKHLQHIGGQSPLRRFFSLRASSSTNVDENDPDVQAFFTQAGVTEKHLRNRNSRRAIFDFIDKSGGIEAIRREVRSSTGSTGTTTNSVTSESPLLSPGEETDVSSSLSSPFS